MDISKKKPSYKIKPNLEEYMVKYERSEKLPITYSDMLRWSGAFPLYDSNDEDTLWQTVMYDPSIKSELEDGLTKVYALLKTEGNTAVINHLRVDRIDYCQFGNSNPFRVKIINLFNDNYDYFYVKIADASRVYGLELEHILSPNRINYLVDGNSLIEEHIAGIPGDKFMVDYLKLPNFNKIRLAKEFVKFNERCFMRLLGDMRSYNYVVDVTPDFDNEQYRIRAIDFDQQSYEGRKNMYLPQFFKENYDIVKFGIEILDKGTVKQYQYEERILMKRRYNSAKVRIGLLLDSMQQDNLSKPEKIKSLKKDLNQFHKGHMFDNCRDMGDILKEHLHLMFSDVKPVK